MDVRGDQALAGLAAWYLSSRYDRYLLPTYPFLAMLSAAVIVMERDELVAPERQHKLAASIPGATVHLVDGDHSACVARADLFVPALIEACQSVLARPAARIPQDAARTPPPSS